MDRMHFGQHSSSQFNEALESIRNHLMEMGGLVEKQVVDALEALLHSMQQAARVSHRTAYFHLGRLIEVNDTETVFTKPEHELTEAYITGRFG